MSTELPNPPLPPVTAEEFADGCGFKYRDIPVCEDENAYWVYTHGHIDRRLFADVVNDYDEELAGPIDEDDKYDFGSVEHRWAVTLRTSDDPEGWLIAWPKEVTEQTPGAFPMTVVSR